MEVGGASRIGSSSRRLSSRWRNTGGDVFSCSNRDEDDESALTWAALERLPTYDRLRKGILTRSSGGAEEVEVTSLGLQERKRLIDRLVREADEDNEKFLLKLRGRLDRVGIMLPTIEVRFEHLKVEGEAHVGARAVSTFLNYTLVGVEEILNNLRILPSRKTKFTILNNVSGIIKPSRMTLLLGPPSSGKTTLLLALAGNLDPSLKISGRVTYNGHNLNEFVPEQTAAYISQHDVHIGEMTVRETLAFSAKCQGVGSRYDMLSELSRREKIAGIKPDPDIDIFMKAAATKSDEANVITDYVIKILGLEVCADTMVGDEMTRGISGGQKKRVTTGEMLVGPAGALFMDEISTGLDSSTTYGIVNCLRQSIKILDGTAVISLLQPAPETYDLFDDIILLSDGQIVYQGPREEVIPFFESVGFKCPARKAIADFLQEVTSRKDQEQYWARREVPYRFMKVQEFVEAYQSFSAGKKLADELATPFDRSKSHGAALTKVKYGASTKELLRACFSREYLLMERGSFFYYFKFFQVVLIAIIAMTIFLRTKMHKRTLLDGSTYSGALCKVWAVISGQIWLVQIVFQIQIFMIFITLFFGVMMIMFNGMAETPLAIAKLPVFFKQRDLQFYPAWIYGLPTWILKIPVSFIEVAIWVFITYYVTGFDPNAGRLFKQYLAYLVMSQMASGLFRANAAICRTMVVANTLGSFILLMIFVLGGYVLSRDDIKKWWKWAYWISPMMYAQNAVVVNEFLGKSWSHVLPSSNVSLGVAVLKSRGFFTEAYWYWLGVGAMLGFTLFFNCVMVVALTFLNPFQSHQAIILEEPQSTSHGEAGGSVQLTRTESSRAASRRGKGGMVLPFEPHSLVFDEVVYSVDVPQEMKSQGIQEDRLMLLRSVTGVFRPGVLTALMGVSGAGKTTLMDVLAGRKTGGYIQGSITVSGYPKKQETFARISGYCEQNDIHSPYVSVYESIVYSAWLRLSPEIDAETRKEFIEEVMELVELNPLRQMLVGLPGVDGLSTEQRKRLTIAVELVANPSIIFMDEPTSGLDARAAAIVMRTVRNTVDTGRTVVCTIHQPSIDIFEAFDELFLMKRGGEEIYVGPLGHHSCHLISYFEGIEGVSKIKDGYNPATWMLEVTSPAQEVALGVDFAEIYRNSELYKRTKALARELSQPAPGSKELYFPTQYSQPFLSQCLACLWKQHRSYWCNPSYTTVRFLFTTFIALFFGTMFWDLGSKVKKQQDLFNAMGSMYASVLFLGVQNATTVQPIISVERTVFYRERGAGMYSSMPYAIGQATIELPYILMQTIVYGVIVYSMMSFEWTAVKFCWFMFFMYFSLLYFTFYGMTAVAMSPNQQVATIISSGLYGMWNLFSGFIVPRPKTPVWWRWFCWTCPVAWTLYGLVVSQFGDIDDMLEDDGISVKQFIRSYFGFKHDFLWAVGIFVPAFSIFFVVMFALSIRFFNFQNR